MNTDDLGTVYDPPLHTLPDDNGNGPERVRIQQLFRLERVISALHDEFAVRLIKRLGGGTPGVMTGVNIQDEEMRQFFSGMAKLVKVKDDSGDVTIVLPPEEDRHMPKGAGLCNFIVAGRTLALPLNNLLDFPRFASNPVVDAGIMAYNGAPLLTPAGLVYDDGTPVPEDFVFGTLWIVSPKAEEWTTDSTLWIKALANELRDIIVAEHLRRQRR